MRASRSVTIPSASMADVAFLLLLFFLITAAIRSDAGLPLTLPPKLDDGGMGSVVTLSVLVDARGAVLLDGEPTSARAVRARVGAFASGGSRRVTLRTHRATPYDAYVGALDAILLGHRDAGAKVRLAVLDPVGG